MNIHAKERKEGYPTQEKAVSRRKALDLHGGGGEEAQIRILSHPAPVH